MRAWFFIIAIMGMTVGRLAEDQAVPASPKADRAVVMKKEHTLTLMSQGRTLKTYKIALGGEPVGAKVTQGDHRTPEGIYHLDRRNPRMGLARELAPQDGLD